MTARLLAIVLSTGVIGVGFFAYYFPILFGVLVGFIFAAVLIGGLWELR
jgi:hypothetical protein